MKKLISAVALAAMVGAGQLAVAAPVQAAGLPQIHYDNQHSFTIKKGKKLPNWSKKKHISSKDYKRYHLKTPPRGYEWVRVGDNFIMVAIASGIIGAIFGAIAASH
jgi:Ni/Co efflux regulator RcnB